jgi:predicted nucleotidyltransferase
MKKPISSKKEQLFKKMTSEQKIAEILYKHPYKEFTLSGIAKEAGVSKSRTSTILTRMVKHGFIILEKLGSKLWRIRANNESFEFRKRKIVYNLNAVYSSGIVEFLNEYFQNPKSIILFGSFRSGEDGEGSDIDIAVETVGEKKLEVKTFKEFRKLENLLGRKIKVHIFGRKGIDKNLFANIANGIVLYGFLEVSR